MKCIQSSFSYSMTHLNCKLQFGQTKNEHPFHLFSRPSLLCSPTFQGKDPDFNKNFKLEAKKESSVLSGL